jgi:alcohol dehydrogenase
MKALVYTRPGVLEYRDEPDPKPDEGEALIEVNSVGICGSDLHGYLGHDARRVPPLILGHEICGRAVSGALQGKRVVLNPLITCGRCDDCVGGRTNLCRERQLIGMARPGALADLITMPETNLVAIPDSVDPCHAALSEPAATALHAVRLAGASAHRTVANGRCLVLGGGAIGLLTALELRRQGCRDIALAETNPLRRQTAANTGACTVFDPTEPGAAPDDDSFDIVFDAVGANATRKLVVAAVRSGGVICHTGLAQGTGEMDFRKLTLAEVTLVGTYTYTAEDFRVAVSVLCKQALGPLDWVEERPLAQGAEAFADLHEGRSAAAKIVLTPPQTSAVS